MVERKGSGDGVKSALSKIWIYEVDKIGIGTPVLLRSVKVQSGN